jgi:hypothetical protein
VFDISNATFDSSLQDAKPFQVLQFRQIKNISGDSLALQEVTIDQSLRIDKKNFKNSSETADELNVEPFEIS